MDLYGYSSARRHCNESSDQGQEKLQRKDMDAWRTTRMSRESEEGFNREMEPSESKVKTVPDSRTREGDEGEFSEGGVGVPTPSADRHACWQGIL